MENETYWKVIGPRGDHLMEFFGVKKTFTIHTDYVDGLNVISDEFHPCKNDHDNFDFPKDDGKYNFCFYSGNCIDVFK